VSWSAASRPRPSTTATARAAAVVVLAASLGWAEPARGDVRRPPAVGEARLRVLTFNVFGIPRLSPAIDERMAAIGPAILRLDPDVVLLQEAWRLEDTARITDALRGAGFVAVRSFGTEHWADTGRSGLLVATKLAIVGERFVPFEAGTLPHIPWHLDWHGGKGWHVVRLATAVGEIGVVNVHAQASYETGHYEAVRVAQALELASGLGAPGSIVGPGDPLVLGGDVNAPPAAPSTRLLEVLTGTRVSDRTLDTDVIMARSGERMLVEIASTERVLTEPLRLADGTAVPLSDHEGVLAELILRRCEGGCADAPRPPMGAVQAARAALAEDRARTERYRLATMIGAAGSAWLGVRAGRILPRRPRRREQILLVAFVLVSLFWAAWWTYTAFGFVPHHLDVLDRAEGALAAAGSRRHASVTGVGPEER
jgi:hypothetical protein